MLPGLSAYLLVFRILTGEYVLVPTLSISVIDTSPRLFLSPLVFTSFPSAMTEAKYVQNLKSIPKENFLVSPPPYLTDLSSVRLRSNTYQILHLHLAGK